MRVSHAVLICFCALSPSLVDAATYATSYAVLTLGGAGAGDVNNRGQVLGVESGRLFVWSEGSRTFLDNPMQFHYGGPYSSRGTINDSGMVAGTYVNNNEADSPGYRAFRWNSRTGEVDILERSYWAASALATGINNAGTVVGFESGGFDNYPWLWRPGAAAAENLPFLAEPVGIDSSGRVAGGAVVVQPNGSVTALPLDAVPLGMNSDGDVVGRQRMSPQTVVLWNGGAWQTLFSVGSGQVAFPIEINNRRDVIVNRHDGSGGSQALLSLATGGGRQTGALDDLVSDSVRELGIRFTSGGGINDHRQVTATMLVGGNSVGARVTAFNKFKQFDNTAEFAWGPTPLRPSTAGSPTFTSSGCTVTALATVASLYGIETDPLRMRDWIEANEMWDSADAITVNINGFRVTRPQDGRVISTRRAALSTQPGAPAQFWNLQTVEQELRAGNPVLLRVPSRSATAGNPAPGSHYVVAFGLRPTLNGQAEPADILISEPGYGPGTYRFDDRGAGADLTLQRYFDLVNENISEPFADHDPVAWFNEGNYSSGLLDNQYRRTLVTKFVTDAPPQASVVVQSPVELVLTDRLTGEQYTSSALAAGQVGAHDATLLARMEADWVSAVTDFELEPGFPGPLGPADFNMHPPYTLVLPPELVGRSLDVTIVGTDFGQYTITYHTGSSLYLTSSPLSGSVFGFGDVKAGVFDVTPVPEPGVMILPLIALGCSTLRRRAGRHERTGSMK